MGSSRVRFQLSVQSAFRPVSILSSCPANTSSAFSVSRGSPSSLNGKIAQHIQIERLHLQWSGVQCVAERSLLTICITQTSSVRFVGVLEVALNLMISPQVQESENSYEDGGQWFYEGRGGWWQYDQRTSVEIEAAMAREEERCELLIAGSLYIIDFEHMLQYRRNDPSRRRRIKRDQASGPKKGVAGLRLDVVEEPLEENAPDAAADDVEANDAEDPTVRLIAALDGLSVEHRDGQVEEDDLAQP